MRAEDLSALAGGDEPFPEALERLVRGKLERQRPRADTRGRERIQIGVA
jgi:hypothetical protein